MHWNLITPFAKCISQLPACEWHYYWPIPAFLLIDIYYNYLEMQSIYNANP
jgi:hypothetical protein